MEVICHPRLKYNGSNLSKRAHQAAIYPYLLRKVTASYPNHVWELDVRHVGANGIPAKAGEGESTSL